MTTLIAWVGVDPRGTSSLNLASDSRISFEPRQEDRTPKHVVGNLWWNVGVKLFACKSSPDIFGYCGDVIFPALVLNQFVAAVDKGLVFPTDADAARRSCCLEEFVKRSHSIHKNAPKNDFAILHAARDGDGMLCTFSMKAIAFEARNDS